MEMVRLIDKIFHLINNMFSTKKSIVNSLCAIGVTCIGAGVGSSFKEEVLLSIFRENGFLKTIVSNTDWSLILLGIVAILLAIWIHLKSDDNVEKVSSFVINHSSIETTAFNLSENGGNEFVFLDQVKEMKVLNKKNIKTSIEKVNDFSKDVLSKTDRRKNLDVFYYGLSHIPLTILLGYQISNKIKVSHSEWNQDKSRWDLIKEGNSTYPNLINTSSNGTTVNSEDVVLKIEITTFISDSHLEELALNSNAKYSLSLENPERNILKSEKQLQEYQSQFRDIMDKINLENPNAKAIHLFYSGPPSLAFKIGSAISQRMDKEILVYNFSMKETPKYKWYLKLKKNNEKIEFEIRKDDFK